LRYSAVSGHSGELKLTFYRNGVQFKFEKGRIIKIEAYKPDPHGYSGDVCFPGMTFLQVLFGYRSLDELRQAYADCIVENDTGYALVNALFPRKPSDLWPIA
jgi:hypothetical protein